MIIYFVGMMGSGKSTVSKIFAEKTNYPFIDLDILIQEKAKKSIQEIFDGDGEKLFRKLESETLEALSGEDAVIACGGGIVLKESNLKQLKSGTVVYLKASIPKLIHRLEKVNNRPLIKGKNIEDELLSILDERGRLYTEAANIIIDVNDKTPEQITNNLIEQLNL
ncbi:MAG TPA: shikimate kinase [Candidatus Marinimicrobia bacterium]|nr:shikimate kinase [Candidatus Neomarinimicrobiota bacterium]